MDNEFIDLITISGKVKSFRPINQTTVQLGFEEGLPVAELKLVERWVLSKGDIVTLSGYRDVRSGMFYGRAYKNHTKGIIGGNSTSYYRFSIGKGTLAFGIIALIMILSTNLLAIVVGFTVLISTGFISYCHFQSSKYSYAEAEWNQYALDLVEEDTLVVG